MTTFTIDTKVQTSVNYGLKGGRLYVVLPTTGFRSLFTAVKREG